jgi:hypothetical protein
MRELTTAAGASSERVTGITAGSTACAQQPHVAHVGGHAASSVPDCSEPVQGSPAIRVGSPEVLNISKQTMMARTNRRTMRV